MCTETCVALFTTRKDKRKEIYIKMGTIWSMEDLNCGKRR
jgi:hypothetical protein